ncbi:MAG: sialate O-acetylesterase [Luteolibacter sp.]
MTLKPCLFLSCIALAPVLNAELVIPAIIGDHMVLQQKQENPIWGWDTPGTKVTIAFAGQSLSGTAGGDGRWTVKLAPLTANATPQSLTITGSSKREIKDILIGEVWMCSGQSNMGYTLARETNGDLETAASDYPNLRLLKIPHKGTQELQTDFKSSWQPSTPASSANFSAVGFLYGRYLHQILKVPVGLIDNSWGASSAEAWVRRETLEKEPLFKPLMDSTVKQEDKFLSAQGKADMETARAKWKEEAEKAKAEGKNPPNAPSDWLTTQYRPGNIFAGVLNATIGYGIKGVIWYQGETNADRAAEYRDLFPFMITQWRKEWGQGDFPFYWVQLADFKSEKPTPAESSWAELREAQSLAMKLSNTGQAVIIDVGEGKDIHPHNKLAVAARLARWPLAKDYGMKLDYRSPDFKNLSISGNKATVTLDCYGSNLHPFDVAEAVGFTLCGADKVWHVANGKITGRSSIEVTSPEVAEPVAVRYAWADNPVCNLYSESGLPVTPFRSDDFEMLTKPKTTAPASAN